MQQFGCTTKYSKCEISSSIIFYTYLTSKKYYNSFKYIFNNILQEGEGHSIFDAVNTTASSRHEQSSEVTQNTEKESEGETFTVDVVLNHRKEDDGKKCYLVRWDGFASDHNSWEPAANFMDATPVSDYLWGIIDNLQQQLKHHNA